MRIPEDFIIPDKKIAHYLLLQKARNDKSKFLAQAGFTLENPVCLRSAIFEMITEAKEAFEDGSNQYGTFYKVTGKLIGTNGVHLSVVTIWILSQTDGTFQFVTLKPNKDS
jgi:hypothetical protein